MKSIPFSTLLEQTSQSISHDYLAGRGAMRSPGAPSHRRETERRFWEQIATGITSEKAAEVVGVSPAVGARWFRHNGGMLLSMLSPISGRYLSFAEREEIGLLSCQGVQGREIARRIGRSPSTVSRELTRNAATRSRDGLSAEAPGSVPQQGIHRHAVLLPVVGRAGVQVMHLRRSFTSRRHTMNFDTPLSLCGPLRQPQQMLADQEYSGHSSIHDDAMAEKLGFRGGPLRPSAPRFAAPVPVPDREKCA